MQVLATALGLVLAAPPPASGIGVVWHDQATVARDVRQRLALALAEQAGAPVVADAVLAARQSMAQRVEARRMELAQLLDTTLTGAASQYRAGALDDAASGIAGVVAAVEDDPVLPGAAAMLWRAHVLSAQIAWTRGDDAAVTTALLSAIALDPEARPSTRRVQPAIVTRYDELAARTMEDRSEWAEIDVRVGGPVQIEVDGRPAMGTVPAGSHVVVVRRPGHPPVGRIVQAGAPLEIAEDAAVIGEGLPRNAPAAERICDATGLDTLVLARAKGDRVALQAYACDDGFAPTWFSRRGEEATAGVTDVLAARPGGKIVARLHTDAAWPEPALADGDRIADGGRDGETPKTPWFRRWWVWTLVGVAVVGGVTTGAVLGTRDRETGILVDTDSFTR